MMQTVHGQRQSLLWLLPILVLNGHRAKRLGRIAKVQGSFSSLLVGRYSLRLSHHIGGVTGYALELSIRFCGPLIRLPVKKLGSSWGRQRGYRQTPYRRTHLHHLDGVRVRRLLARGLVAFAHACPAKPRH